MRRKPKPLRTPKETVPLSPAALSSTRYTTQSSLDRKYAYLSDLEAKLKVAKEDKKISHAEGDLRENFGFKAAKMDIARIHKQIAHLQKVFTTYNYEPINPLDWANQTPKVVSLGAEVTLKRDSMRFEETYIICGVFDSDFEIEEMQENQEATMLLVDNLMSYTSPLINQLMDRKEGEVITIQLHDRSDRVQILKIKAPSKEKLERVYSLPELDMNL